jgi:hypothetical protein
MNAPRISSQLKPSIERASGSASPLSKRYDSIAAKPKMAAATWPYVRQMNVERASVLNADTGV